MSDTAAAHRERIITIAHQALETTIAHQLTNWSALTVLVAEPGGHLDHAIELLVDRRPEAVTIARNELEQLTEAERERFELQAARHTALAMTVAADMLASTGRLFDAPDVYDVPPYVVAALGAALTTSGLLKNAIELLDQPD
jgi:anthranilate phosphoribosyltransferase